MRIFILINIGPFLYPHFNLVFRNLDSGTRLSGSEFRLHLLLLGKVLSLSAPQFSHLYKGVIITASASES